MEHCRFCQTPLKESFVSLGASPLANSYIPIGKELLPERFFSLHAKLCDQCFLVQLPELEKSSDIFTNYAYYSSFSDSWLAHCRQYVDMIIEKSFVQKTSSIVEIASNDGYLLQFFRGKGYNVLGIEPAENVAQEAIEKRNINTLMAFFSEETAKAVVQKQGKADLLIANNVLAHVPDISDFVTGLSILLAEEGVVTIEFPHLLQLIRENQFDTIYHEHFSYLSLYTVRRIFDKHGLQVFDVETLPTHGGSLRIYAQQKATGKYPESERLHNLLAKEMQEGITSIETYRAFETKVKKCKRDILTYFIAQKEKGLKICAYGAPAKGNTLLNYCGIGTDFIDFTVDKNPHKHHTLLPGSRLPVYDVSKIVDEEPDIIVILPWNLKAEIISQLKDICSWQPLYVTLIPRVEETRG